MLAFTPLDLNTFRAQFEDHVIHIKREVTFWRVYVDGRLTSILPNISARVQQLEVQTVVARVLASRAAAAARTRPILVRPQARQMAVGIPTQRWPPTQVIPQYLLSAKQSV